MHLKTLSNENSSFAEVVAAISALESSETGFERSCSFGLSTNITIENLSVELKRQSFLYGQRPYITVGNYRDNVGNAERFASLGIQYAVFLWFFDAIVPSCQTRAGTFSERDIDDLCASFASELRAVLRYSEKFERVFVIYSSQIYQNAKK